MEGYGEDVAWFGVCDVDWAEGGIGEGEVESWDTGGGGGCCYLVVAAIKEGAGEFGARGDGEDWSEGVVPFEVGVAWVDVEGFMVVVHFGCD